MSNHTADARESTHALVTSSPPGAGLARFMELRGKRVVEKAGVLWHSVGFGLYMSFPYHLQPEICPGDAVEIVRAMGALGVRYASREWVGLPSGIYVLRRRSYDISSIHRGVRSAVRQGLKVCEIRPATDEELVTAGLQINLETMRRQQRYDPEFGDPKRWRRLVGAIAQCPSITALGAFVDGCLAAYAICSFEDGWIEVLYQMTSNDMWQWHPCKALDYAIARRIVTDPGVTAVSMGWAPLIPNQGLHGYKVRMGFELEPQWSVIRLHPLVERTMTGKLGWAALHLASQVCGAQSQTMRMTAAVLDGAMRSSPQRRSAPSDGTDSAPGDDSSAEP